MCCKARTLLRISTLMMLLVSASLVVGCGKKGPPLPPLRDVPAATTDLTLSQQGRNILFEMTYPATTVSGMVLGGIDSVQLFLLTKPAGEGEPPTADAAEMEAAGEILLSLLGTDLQSSIVGDRIQLRIPMQEPLPEEPTANIFAVRTTKGLEESVFSNRVTLVPQEPPSPPSDLATNPKAAGIELSWTSSVDAQGFDVFRRFATERGYGEPIARVPGDKTTYFDRKVKYGEQYIYMVRTVTGEDPEISSEQAGDREVDYDDRFPPRLPRNFVALPEQGSVRLRWDPSPDPDATGYLVFRQDPRQSEFVQITTDPISGTEYLDRGLASGLTFRYRLQAIDGAGNQSRRSDPIAATTR